MSWQAWLFFVPACIGMNLFPGPNNMLALVNGTRTSITQATIAGLARLPVMVVMLFGVAVGLELLMQKSGEAIMWVRYVGGAYLIWMGWQAFKSAKDPVELEQAGGDSIRTMAIREALVASTNPKLFLIFAAFFPQFIVPDQDPSVQIFWMGLTFVVIEVGAIMVYAAGGNTLARWLKGEKGGPRLKRGTGVSLWAAAAMVLQK